MSEAGIWGRIRAGATSSGVPPFEFRPGEAQNCNCAGALLRGRAGVDCFRRGEATS